MGDAKWFVAEVILACRVGKDPAPSLWERRVLLLTAVDDTQARTAAEIFGDGARHEYFNNDNDLVVWTFVKVASVKLLDEQPLGTSVEIFSEFRWEEP